MNHLDLVGWINTARYKWAEIRGREIKFKPATFYLGVADLLARKVERIGADESDSESERESASERGKGDSTKDLGRKVADEGTKDGGREEEKGVNGTRAEGKVRDEEGPSDSTQELGKQVAGEGSRSAASAPREETKRSGTLLDTGTLDPPVGEGRP